MIVVQQSRKFTVEKIGTGRAGRIFLNDAWLSDRPDDNVFRARREPTFREQVLDRALRNMIAFCLGAEAVASEETLALWIATAERELKDEQRG